MDYETVQAAYDDSRVVIVGTALPSASTSSVFGLNVPLHEVSVDRVVKGDYTQDPLLVAAAPETCPGPGPDPLETDATVILFLVLDGAVWRTITPYDGVVPLPEDGTLPFAP